MIQRALRKLEFLWLETKVKPFDHFLQRFRGSMNQRWPSLDVSELRPQYERYIDEISVANMAASLELSTFLLDFARTNKCKHLLDLGSGLSSFVFRKFANEYPEAEVVSVDDNEAWLEKTAQFLKSRQLDTSNLLTLQDFLQSGQTGFDLILHDLNFVEVRIRYVEAMIERLAPGGMIVFDDVHKRDYLHALLKLLNRQPGVCYSLKPVTTDQFGRYALAYLAPPA